MAYAFLLGGGRERRIRCIAIQAEILWLPHLARVLCCCIEILPGAGGQLSWPGGRPGIVNQRVALSLEMAVDYLECEALCRTVAGLYIRSNPAYQVR